MLEEEVIRLLAAFCCGMLMSIMGSFIQLRSQNILASTSTIGLDSLSILWILLFHTLSVLLGIDFSFNFKMIIGVLVFTLFGGYISHLSRKSFKIERLLLLGLALNLFVGALYSLWQFLFLAFNFDFPTELIFGHFRFVEFKALWIVISCLVLFLGGLKIYWKDLEIYSTGNDIASLAGFNSNKMSQFFLISSSVTIFILVFLFGGFAFLGLILPILSRGLWFKRWGLRGEFILGALVNGALFMLIDFVCYSFPVAGAEVPVGLLSGAIGSLSLILILRRTNSW